MELEEFMKAPTVDAPAITTAIAIVAPEDSISHYEIVGARDLEQAADDLRYIKGQLSALDTLRKSITKPLDDSKTAVMNLFRPVVERLEAQDRYLRAEVVRYNRAVEATRRAEEAQLRDAQSALQLDAEERAANLTAQGKTEQAEAVLATVPSVPVVIVDKPAVGLGTRKNWKAKVLDFEVLVLYALEHNQSLIQIDEKVLAQLARDTQGKMLLPGVEFYAEDGVVVR